MGAESLWGIPKDRWCPEVVIRLKPLPILHWSHVQTPDRPNVVESQIKLDLPNFW